MRGATARLGQSLAVLGLLAGAYVGWRLAVEGGGRTTGLVADLIFFPFYPLAGLAALAAARATSGWTRLGWRLGAAGWLLPCGGEALYLLARAWPAASAWMELLGDLLDAAYYPLMAAGLLAFAAPPRTLPARLRHLADAAVTVVAVHSLAWYFVYRHLEPGEPVWSHFEKVFCSGGGEMLVLFAASIALDRPRPEAGGRALHVLAAGVFAFGLGDLASAQQAMRDLAGSSLVGDALLALGATLAAAAGLLAAAPGELLRWRWGAEALRAAGRVPGLAVVTVLVLLCRELLTAQAFGPAQGLAAGTAALAVLVLVRLAAVDRELVAEAAARTQRELRLQHAEHLEALGQLAGAVAHDFNNLLTGLGGAAASLRERLPAGDAEIGEVEATVRRGSSLCRQLLAYGRRDRGRAVPCDLLEVVEGMRPLLRRVLPRGVTLAVEGGRPGATVLADQVQLEVALLNLVVNARDAMPRGGTIRVRLGEAVVAPGGRWAQRGVPGGRWLRLAVADDGDGMDPATLRRATEPFFTTKPPGKGTGLGLSTVHGVAVACHGHLDLESTLGRGTVATLLLPPHQPA